MCVFVTVYLNFTLPAIFLKFLESCCHNDVTHCHSSFMVSSYEIQTFFFARMNRIWNCRSLSQHFAHNSRATMCCAEYLPPSRSVVNIWSIKLVDTTCRESFSFIITCNSIYYGVLDKLKQRWPILNASYLEFISWGFLPHHVHR